MELTKANCKQGASAVLLYITVKDVEEADSIATHLIEHRLAACANILPRITSVYEWGGKVRQDSETLVLVKTRCDLAEKVRRTVAELHSYEVPAINTIPLDHVHPPYMEWLLAQTSAR